MNNHDVQIQTVLLKAKQALKQISDTPQLDAELLLAHVLGITRTQLLTHVEQVLTSQQQQLFAQLLNRRLLGEPIAYILGYREFWSLQLTVTPATLIPRPETELLVELILQKFPAQTVIKVADLGTGSGAIALALAHERPHWSIVAIDNNADALAVAKHNATRLGVMNVSFRCGNWCEALADEYFTVIVSNPPYITADDPHLNQGDLRFEPRFAVVSADQGLADLEKIIAMARTNLAADGWLLLEHGYDQADAVQKLLLRHNYHQIANYTDFTGIRRVTCAKL